MTRKLTALTVVLLAACTLATARDPVKWVERRDVYNLTGNLSFGARWDPDKGTCFKIARGGTDKAVLVTLAPGKCSVRLLPDSRSAAATEDKAQFNQASLPETPLERAEIVVKFRRRIWTVYLENRPVAVFPVPFVPPLLLLQPEAQVPLRSLREVRFQRTASFRFEDDFMVPEGSPNQLVEWETESGTWRLTSAADNGVSTDRGRRRGDPKPAFSPNFYSAVGSGTDAIMTAGHDFYDSYTMSASTRVVPGEMGIVFFFRKNKGYHAFTIDMKDHTDDVTLSLWRVRPDDRMRRETLAAVSARLTREQWVQLRAKTFLNRIQCFLDGVKVIDVTSELPAGGRFGLYATHPQGIRFDDVAAEFNRDLDFAGVSRLRRYCLHEEGNLFPGKRQTDLFPADKHHDYLEVKKSKQDQWLALGAMEHQGQVFSADFEPNTRNWTVGLLAGFTTADKSHLRFTCRRSDTNEVFRLVNVTTNGTAVLEELKLPAGPARREGTKVSLMCDATIEGELRLYRDGQLVLIHHPRFPPLGAAGLFVGAGTATRISNPQCRFHRDDLYRNQFEKNRAFRDDPFMRHWSSPEGQWITMPDNSTWHKSDFFGRFLLRMPRINGSEIHLGIEEGRADGTVIIKATANSLTMEGKNTERLSAPCSSDWYTIHYEDHWLWVTGNKKLLMRRPLTTALKGTRIRIAGLSTEQLKNSYVERFNVKDHLFTKSLHEWVLNGGKWAVVNRFKCQPRWSHMTGETEDGLAALWSKFDFTGDFCAEMYAGMRHGWYARAGDLNLTMMTDATTPGRGYTVTCTGWDVDHSQLFTRFFRNGKVLEKSDKFLVPRHRESFQWNDANVRKGWNPLIQKGRPLHGSWFYIKLRRIGNRLEYYFDNELVFSVEDSDPIPDGRFGIWTFMNSMVVARVKVAARHIRPRAFTFTPLTIDKEGRPVRPPKPDPPRYEDIACNSQPLESCSPGRWKSDDPTGQSRLAWHRQEGLGPYFVSTSTLGGGEAFTRSTRPPTGRGLVAGWRFYVKQTPDARFNFHYSLGRMKDGSYEVQRSFFHHLSGSDFTKGTYRLTGSTTVPPTPGENRDWHTAGEWALVEAWIPTHLLGKSATDGQLIRVEGFGNLQPSDIKQGLDGNGPGAAYAIRDFSEICYAAPKITLLDGDPPRSLAALDKDHKTLSKFRNTAELTEWLAKATQPGLVEIPLRITRKGNVTINELAWINLPDRPSLSCRWHPEKPATVQVSSGGRYPDSRLNDATMGVAGVDVPLTHERPGLLAGTLPRLDALSSLRTNTILITITAAGKSDNLSVNWEKHPHTDRPVLLATDGLTPFLETFEDRALGSPVSVDRQRMALDDQDPLQGCYLKVFNPGKQSRLNCGFATPVHISRYPVFQFRYRGWPMSQITMSLDGSTRIRLTEKYEQVVSLRSAAAPALDGDWHTWYGILSDTVRGKMFSENAFLLNSINMASVAKIDQTGLFSEWHLDDVVFGPAIASADQLKFTPRFFAFGGVASVATAVRQGPEPLGDLSEEQLADLRWQTSTNAAEIVPDLTSLTNGMCHMFIKATGNDGTESVVTDVPFLLAAGKVKASYEFVASGEPEHNGSILSVSVDAAGAPLDTKALELRWNGREVDAGTFGSSIVRSSSKEQLLLNWPYIFREQLRSSSDDQIADITVASIRNGAGTACPDIIVPLTINYAKDKTPPTLLPTKFPGNVLWCTGWESLSRTASELTKANEVSTLLVRKPNEEPYLRVTSTTTKGFVARRFTDRKWTLKEYPFLAFRIRIPKQGGDYGTGPRLTIRLMSDRKHSYLIPITHTSYRHRRYVHTEIPENLHEQPDVWHSVIIDFREALQSQLPSSDIERLRVRELALIQNGTKHMLHLLSFYVYAAAAAADKVTVDAFDMSGIDGVSIEFAGRTRDMAVSAAALGSKTVRKGWLLLRARDRAGNLSTPIRVPVWPTREE